MHSFTSDNQIFLNHCTLGMQPVAFHGVNAPVQVFGRTADQGYLSTDPLVPTTGNMFAVRHTDGSISVVGQVAVSRCS